MGAHLEGEAFEGVKLYRAHMEGCLPHAIWVNRKGERFCDETFYKDFGPCIRFFDGRSNTQPNFPVYLIMDSNYHGKYPMGTIPPGDPVPRGYYRRGATLRELAEKLGIDGDGLEKTVERFNKFAEQGHDEDFGRGEYLWAKAMLGGDDSLPNPQMGVLNKPPYYGLRITYVSVGINAVGLKFNEDAQVLNTRGEPVRDSTWQATLRPSSITGPDTRAAWLICAVLLGLGLRHTTPAKSRSEGFSCVENGPLHE